MSTEEFDLTEARRLMEGAVNILKNEFSGLRTGRASASMVDHISVEVYGSRMALNQVATVSVPEPRMISIQVWDRGQVDAVTRAILESELGLNPVVEGTVLRLPIPELNQERRRDLARVAHKYAEQARISVRNVRREAMDRLKRMEKERMMSQDEQRAWGEEVQSLTDEIIKKVDGLLTVKEAEIMQV